MNNEIAVEFSNFSPEGRLYQIEYAIQAVKMGATVFGIKSDGGIILAVEKKKNSELIENKSIGKIIMLNNFIFCCFSGLTSDGRICIEKIRIFLENNSFLFNDLSCIEKCSRKIRQIISNVASGESGELYINRPLGVSFLVCGFDLSGCHLFSIDPSGNSTEKKIASLGNGSKDAAFVIREGFRDKMTSDENKILALKSMRVVMENKITEKDVEMCILNSNTKKIIFPTQNQIKNFLEKL
nr:26S proteasome SU A5 [Cryptomonas curvata]